MLAKEDKGNAELIIHFREGANSSNKTEHYSFKGEWVYV